MRNILCLSFDGLQSGMLGAYGNTWIHTPAFDGFAVRAALFHRFYAASLNLEQAFGSFGMLPRERKTILLTDDVNVYRLNQASRFDEKFRLKCKHRKHPAGRIEQTQIYRNFSAVAELIKKQNKDPFFLWAHFNIFRKQWDFPLSYRLQYQIDEDPFPYSDTALPKQSSADIEPDVKQAVIEAYSGGVTVLDEAFAGLLAFLESERLYQNLTLLFISIRGFSLGEHGRIGKTLNLYGENVHLSLLIRFPEDRFAGFRSQTLLQPGDVFRLLQTDELPEEPAKWHPNIRIADNVLITPDWFLYKKRTGTELYVKPDDRYEINNVADRCSEILEELEI